MENKQTAINELLTWIKDKNEICKRDFSLGGCNYYTIRILEIIEAKVESMLAEEKKQIIDAHFEGWSDAYDYLKDDFSAPRQAEDYYKETYGK
jgi:hypothetical protein